jgi:3-deoxy-7-phosphoheptulonate synthase
MSEWSPESWKNKPEAQRVAYDDEAALAQATSELRTMPPLVTSWEVERLKSFVAEAQEGKRFLLQGGDCAETLADCRPSVITNKLKILLQMSLVLVHGGKTPVIRVGRFAGQYAKPRSSPTETVDGVTLPSYFGDLVNHAAFDKESRRADPRALIRGYTRAALTLNFIRSLTAGGFADLHHPEYWDMAFLSRADLNPKLREDYTRMSRDLSGALRFMEALGETSIDDLTRVEFFTSHEGLSLHYESAQTRKVPRREGFYDLTAHMPWVGERTRDINGAHVEFFRGIANTVGVKVGPSAKPQDVVDLVNLLNPKNEPGKIVLIARMGASKVKTALPPIVAKVVESKARVLWVTDPMHGNTISLPSGIKTRNFDDILSEIEDSFDAHKSMGTRLGGVHFELTGDDVTECLGGGLSESDLDKNYASVCDPRLNYRQALEMAFLIARRMAQ